MGSFSRGKCSFVLNIAEAKLFGGWARGIPDGVKVANEHFLVGLETKVNFLAGIGVVWIFGAVVEDADGVEFCALGQPFRGVATSDGIIEGLYPIKSTGVSTAPIREAADDFLATLSTADLSRTHFAINDPEWRDWSNVDVGIFPRRGISFEDMSDTQKDAAWNNFVSPPSINPRCWL